MKRSGILLAVGLVAFIWIWYGFFGPSKDFTGNANATDKAEQQLRNLPGLKGKKLHLFRDVSFYDDGRIYITLQSPDTPQHINSYEYHLHRFGGEWQGPIPCKLDQTDLPLSQFLYPLDSVSFANASKLVQTYNAKAKEVGSSDRQTMAEFTQIDPGYWNWKYEDKITGGNDRQTIEYKIIFNKDATIQYFGTPDGWNAMNKPGDFTRAQQLLKNLPKLKGKTLLFADKLQFDDPGHVYINLQNPEHPDQILSYIYFQGVWDEDQEFENDYDSKPQWYPVDKVSFNAATKIADTYAEKLKETGSDQAALNALALDITGTQPKWRFKDTIKGKNGTYVIDFNTDGSLKSYDKLH